MTLLCDLKQVGGEMVCQREGCPRRGPVMAGVPKYTWVCLAGDNYREHSESVQAAAQSQVVSGGLGDDVKQLLASIGITKRRYRQVKKLFGRPPDCNCDSRQQWLNKVSDWWRGEAT